MARRHSSGVYHTGSVPLAGFTYPFTLSSWFRNLNLAKGDAHTLLSIESNLGENNGNISLIATETLGRACVAVGTVDGNQFYCQSTASPAQGEWAHYAGVVNAFDNRTVYLNGGNSASGTGNYGDVPATKNMLHYGYLYGGYDRAEGDICESAIWSAALTAEEITALSRGVSPLLIRPSALVVYWPVYGNEPIAAGGADKDHWKNRLDLNWPNALPPKARHVRVFNPWHTTVAEVAQLAVQLNASASFQFATAPTLSLPAPLLAASSFQISSAATLTAPGGFAAQVGLRVATSATLTTRATFAATPSFAFAAVGAFEEAAIAQFALYAQNANKASGILIHAE